MKKVINNFMYQALYQVVQIILPLITIPIVSKAIGPAGVGEYNYSLSIAQYFSLAAAMGVSLYGNREIAICKKEKRDLSQTFWEIFLVKLTLGSLVILLYLFFCIFTAKSSIFLLQGLVIVSVLFDVSWFFMGIEDFKVTSMMTLVFKIISFILIVFLVNSANDVLIYTFIQSGSVLLPNMTLFFLLKRKISFRKITFSNWIRHLKGMFDFFIPQVAIQLYTNLNKTILGIFLGTVAVGYFTNSQQLNILFVTIITTLDYVLLPHMSSLFAENKVESIINLMSKTINLQLYFSIPIFWGILTVFDKLVPWFFGEEFLYINNLIPLFSILVIVIPLGMSISRQYLMPIGKIKSYNQSVMIGAAINIIGNILLLPFFGITGVVLANIIAELFVTIIRLYSFVKDTNFKFPIRKAGYYSVIGLVMMIITRMVTHNMDSTIITTLVQAFLGAIIYISGTMLLKITPLHDLKRE